MGKLSRSVTGVAAILVAAGMTLMDIRTSYAADQALMPVQSGKAARSSVHHVHRWRQAQLVGAGVVTDGRLTTELANRYGYNIDPYYGYYGGPVYYGGPYYYRPYFDGASPVYYATHPIVEW